MTSTTFETAKVGDRVWCIRRGGGEILETGCSDDYPIYVSFEGGDSATYTICGLFSNNDVTRSLFWDEVVIVAPVKPIPELEVDAKVLVWVSPEHKHRRHFSHFSNNGDINTFDAGSTSFSRLHAASVTTWPFWEVAE